MHSMATDIYRPVPGFQPSTPAVTAKTFANVLAEHSAVAIHFWAEWNGVDVPMDRSIRDIKVRLKESIHFVSCDIDSPDNFALCNRCKVVNVPFLAVFVDGQQKGGIMGLLPAKKLVIELGNILYDSPSEKRWWWF